MVKLLDEYNNYYNELENQLIGTLDYVPIDAVNFDTFSIKYNLLYQSICSEVNVVMKELAKRIAPDKNCDGINSCRGIIMGRYPSFTTMKVIGFGLENELCPWEKWDKNENPIWWKTYNAVKHDRTGIDSDDNIQNYKLANQKNVIYALAGLIVLEWYLLNEYKFTEEEIEASKKFYAIHENEAAVEKRKEQLALNLNRHVLKISNFRHLQTFFMGYHHFDYKKFKQIVEGIEA